MSRYLKLFLATGIPFGISMGMFYSLHGVFEGLMVGLLAGLFFGGFMSLLLGFLHTWSVKRISSGKSEEATSVHHVRSVELRLPYDKAFNLCIESLSLLKKYRIIEEDRSQGKIVAKTGMTWKSWGEVITFEVGEIGNDRTQIEVSSRPAVRTTLVDYGKNLENVKTIIFFLKKHAKTAYNSG